LSEICEYTSLSKHQIKKAAEVLRNAFQEDLTFKLLVPEDTERQEMLYQLFKFLVKYGLKRGIIVSTPEIEGLSIWLPPKEVNISPWKAILSGALSLVFNVSLKRLLAQKKIENFTSKLHKKLVSVPHWHFCVIGVDPAHQGKGIGMRMINYMTGRIDKERLLIYLETNLIKNVKFYNRFGFFLLHEDTIPDTDLTLYFMLRNPK